MSWLRRIRSFLSHRGLLADRVPSLPGQLLITAALVAATVVLRVWTHPWLAGGQFTSLFPAVIIATLLFGAVPGLVAVGLSTIAAWIVFEASSLSLPQLNALALFVLVALMDVAVISALLSAIAALRTSLAKVELLNAAARDGEARFRALVEAAPDAMVIAGADGHIVLVNAETERVFGYRREELLGQHVDILMPARFRGRHGSFLTRFVDAPRTRRMGQGLELYGLRKDRSEFPVEVSLSLLGATPLIASAARDVTWRREAEQRQALLIRELNHRVKNTLASVQAIASQTLRTAESPEAFNEALTARLIALSQSHDALTRHDWVGAPIGDIVAEQLRPYDGVSPRFNASGPDVRLSPERAVTLGMLLGELATNAAKYGALSMPNGAVDVTWSLRGAPDRPAVQLVWRERNGPAVVEPRRRGFGSRLIERGGASALQGAARLEFSAGGLVCRLEFPLTPEDVHGRPPLSVAAVGEHLQHLAREQRAGEPAADAELVAGLGASKD